MIHFTWWGHEWRGCSAAKASLSAALCISRQHLHPPNRHHRADLGHFHHNIKILWDNSNSISPKLGWRVYNNGKLMDLYGSQHHLLICFMLILHVNNYKISSANVERILWSAVAATTIALSTHNFPEPPLPIQRIPNHLPYHNPNHPWIAICSPLILFNHIASFENV